MRATQATRVAPVTRSRAEARASYDRIAPFYDLVEAPFTRAHRRRAIELLAIERDERVLDVGCGTGAALPLLAEAAGARGLVVGFDLSEGMLEVARRRLADADPSGRCRLVVGDAVAPPFADASVDVVLLSFTLELFSLDDARAVLGEVRRMLCGGGRMVVVALATSPRATPVQRVYLRVRRHAERWLDCRPIPVRRLVAAAGFHVARSERASLWGLPTETVVATRH